MSFFSSKASYLGVDVGNASVKVVELKNQEGRPQLVTYGFSETAIESTKLNPKIHSTDRIAEVLSDVCSRARTTTTKAIVSLPTFSVFSSVLTLPKMSKKDLESAVHWEAKKVIPLPLEEMNLVWEVINDPSLSSMPRAQTPLLKKAFKKQKEEGGAQQHGQEEKHQEILLTGAPKTLVKRYIDIFQKAGLDLISLETEIFALTRSLVGNDPETTMIVDIGAVTTNISIVSRGIPFLNRSIEVGGITITHAIANSLNISFDRAEQFKRDVGIAPAMPGSGSPVPKTIEAVINPIVQEIQYSINLYQSQYEQRRQQKSTSSQEYFAKVVTQGGGSQQPQKKAEEHTLPSTPQVPVLESQKDNSVLGKEKTATKEKRGVERIILTGGGSYLAHFDRYLSEATQIRVTIGDPWSRVIYPEDLRPVLQEVGAKFAITVGLAMRDIV